MFIAMNRFKVIKEERKAFEDLWVTRESHLDEVKGFRAFHLLRGLASASRSYSATRNSRVRSHPDDRNHASVRIADPKQASAQFL
jgi:heme-degrading monooxygenase HmoA